MDASNIRTLDDINEILRLAKLNEDDILPTSQTIYFNTSNLELDNDNMKFLELDSNLEHDLKEGQTLCIKGNDDENAILCTSNRTYEITGAETSNSLLLIQNMKFFDNLKNIEKRSFQPITVSGIFYEYLSVTPVKPHFDKLMNLLNKGIYKGPELEHEVKEENLYTFEELNRIIQASEKELKDVVDGLIIAKINNKLRLLDVEYHFRILSYMLKLIEENSWGLDEIDYEETLQSLRDLVPEEILICLFDKYTEESKIVDGLQLYSYKQSKVCRFFAQILLYAAEKFNFEDFLQAWKQAVPEGMSPEENLLHGIAIVDRKVNPNTISAFPEDCLPQDINARFDALFQAKEKWTVPEITPYIEAITTPKIDVNALLAKFARASNLNGVKYYSAKHAK